MPFSPTHPTLVHRINEQQWDANGTRYQLISTNPGSVNWLFLPGGAGADSCYLVPLIHYLQLPGNSWVIDLPSNGTNTTRTPEDYPFDQWDACLLSAIQEFENPILIGHSFGGMFPMLVPELEQYLKGFISIGGCSCFDHDKIKKLRAEKNVTIDFETVKNFFDNPTNETWKNACIAVSPYHFAPSHLTEGQELFSTLPFNVYTVLWWIAKISDPEYKISWIPQTIPTLLMGGTEDCINPISIFMEDQRFNRNNIAIATIEGAGHFPWIENKERIKEVVDAFSAQHCIP